MPFLLAVMTHPLQRRREAWLAALHSAETHFRTLVASASASDWKRISTATSAGPTSPGKARGASTVPDPRDVMVHRKTGKAGDDIYRAILDLPVGEGSTSLEPWKAVLTTPELRQEWDPVVQESHLLEVFDQSTRIYKTSFALGWPARCVARMFLSSLSLPITCPTSPRDAVTISRSFHDPSTFLQISTSLPRSPDEPAYLRPSPPFVRSNVTRKCLPSG